jgi:hypothetical protein
METDFAKSALKSIGVSAGIIAGVLVLGGVYFVYKTYLDTILTKLQITQLRGELAEIINRAYLHKPR